MCLYNYNNKFQSNTVLNNEEYQLLSNIYKCIESGDNENATKLTQELISLQSCSEKINELENSINYLK